MEKLAAIKTTSSRIDRYIFDHIIKCAELRLSIENILSGPAEDAVADVQEKLDSTYADLQLISNALVTLAKQIVSVDGETEEIDGEEIMGDGENGIRIQ